MRKKDDTKELNAFLRKLARNKNRRASSHPSGFIGKTFIADSNQQCVFKFRYSNNMTLHKRFVELYMPQLNKEEVTEKPELFGDDIEEYKAHAVAKHFKFIISPENQNVDLENLTKTFIKQFNALYGLDVRYLAVQHNNTNHKHVHIVINGIDKNGKELNRIDKNFIKYTARDLLSRICTIQVGKRSYDEMESQKENTYSKTRLTHLDEKNKSAHV